MAAEGKPRAEIAEALGLAPKTFRKLITGGDKRAQDAFAEGQETDFDAMCAALRLTAMDPNNPKQVAAAQTLAKLKFNKDTDGPTVQITIPQALSPDQYTKLINPRPAAAPAPVQIKQAPEKPLSVAELLGRRRDVS